MTPKEYLNQAYRIDRRINNDLEKLSAIKVSLYGRSSGFGNESKNKVHSGNSIEKAYAKYIDFKDEINAEIDLLIDKKLEIAETIDKLPDERLKEILIRRYLKFQKWDDIAQEMHYSRQHILRLHRLALQKMCLYVTF